MRQNDQLYNRDDHWFFFICLFVCFCLFVFYYFFFLSFFLFVCCFLYFLYFSFFLVCYGNVSTNYMYCNIILKWLYVWMPVNKIKQAVQIDGMVYFISTSFGYIYQKATLLLNHRLEYWPYNNVSSGDLLCKYLFPLVYIYCW
jgi:hypothetical protein